MLAQQPPPHALCRGNCPARERGHYDGLTSLRKLYEATGVGVGVGVLAQPAHVLCVSNWLALRGSKGRSDGLTSLRKLRVFNYDNGRLKTSFLLVVLALLGQSAGLLLRTQEAARLHKALHNAAVTACWG